MANAAKLATITPVRMLLVGYPGAGKTGSLAALANAGYKLRIIDFDGNPESLLQYTKPEFLPNIDILSFEDPLGDVGDYIGVKSLPRAFTDSVRALQRWKYEDPEGTVVDEKTGKRYTDLGPHTEWGPDTVLVLDGLTGQGKAAMRRAQALANKTPRNTTQAVWGLAMSDQEAVTEQITSSRLRHHTIAISHLKMIGPQDYTAADGDLTKELKARAAEIVPTRLWPSALGRQLPQSIAGHYPVVVEIAARAKGNTMRRTFSVYPREDLDLKLPAKGGAVFSDLPVETGLLEIFKALGHGGPK